MRDITDLRNALDAETAHLSVAIGPDQIRRRARSLRARRLATMTTVGLLALAVIAVPAIVFSSASSPVNVGGPAPTIDPSAAATCEPALSKPDMPAPTALGQFAVTGVVLDAPSLGTTFTVEFGLTGAAAQPGYVIAFRDQLTGASRDWDMTTLLPGPGGFRGKRVGDPPLQYFSSQLILGPNRVLDLGVYAHSAQRITVASEGHAVDAQVLPNAETGWTLFWAVRDAAPLPPEATTTTINYDGPEKITIAAFDGAGNPLHTTTMGIGVGVSVQNPRDHTPTPPTVDPSPTITLPPC
jgi:hypothetical protein